MSGDFDTILDRCLADIVAGHETIDSCLRRFPQQAGQLAVLLRAAERARSGSLPAPLSIDKRRALESRLLRRAGQQRSKSLKHLSAPRQSLWRRAVFAVALIVVSLVLLGFAVSASASSVPGDVLYPVKRAAEQVRLTLVPPQEQIELHVEFARQRLEELQVLADRGEVSEDLLAEIAAGTTLVLERIPTLPQDKQPMLLTELTNLQNQQLQVLERMASAAQGETHTRVMEALADATIKRQQAVKLLAGAASDQQPRGNSPEEPPPAGEEATSEPARGKPTTKPNPTEKPAPQATAQATKAHPATPQKPTPKVEHAPQATAQATKAHPATLQKPTPKVEHAPPGKANQPTPHTPPEKPTKVPKN
jgi:hypothetical protein